MNAYGLIGEKLSHSLSPEIHKKVFEKLNLNASFSLYEIKQKNISMTVESLKVLGINGVNVTIPYKEILMEQLDYISEEARNIGAINTIKIEEDRTIGYNTDYFGFGELLLRNDVDVKNKVVAVLGTGGASKAVVQYIADQKAGDIYLVSRDKILAAGKYPNNKCISYSELEERNDIDIIVNTTPVGMFPKVGYSPIKDEVIEKCHTVVDIVYNPLETELLKRAKSLGKKTVDGLYMLIAQGIKAEEIWLDKKLSYEIGDELYKGLSEILNQGKHK
ncbi:shikimate dehydrogenase [Clostridium folliculivorans]|uniref:Shikimate dehydrogenase (NADP(+)) n=1 Tax=Clostridium folliculivorans TaxID=2886038 RepID=A0A9W5Y2T3_9CLOT|nr:shikimate dehydrogenase [Clostridium folliculivorans]GKU25508.1 shikimate dehydrogenase (NADP(+)) [Clostridium folliculivorans]GKU28531.1 shikimate dehydrogenase (NADP(+)) [Clostridium folliculivorans]